MRKLERSPLPTTTHPHPQIPMSSCVAPAVRIIVGGMIARAPVVVLEIRRVGWALVGGTFRSRGVPLCAAGAADPFADAVADCIAYRQRQYTN
eukprot:gene57452-biopygen28374